jgi:hypothetical protein
MNKNKTKATEIACAIGCMGLPLSRQSACIVENVNPTDAASIDDATLTSFLQMTHTAGMALYGYLDTKPKSVQWKGKEKTTNASSAAKDIYLSYNKDSAMVPVSVKVESDIIWNGATSRFLEHIWLGGNGLDGSKGEHWFQKTAASEYQAFFEACDGPNLTRVPTVKEWDGKRRSAEARKVFKLAAAEAMESPQVKAVYKVLCEKVAQESAEIVNTGIQTAKVKAKTQKKRLHEILKNAVWEIFRINSEAYFLCGTELTTGKGKQEKPFVVRMPGKDEWQQRFNIKDVFAIARDKGQPEIQVNFIIEEFEKGEHVFSVKYEIRWSHGKFKGAPESKIYKLFRYADLPWVKEIA